MKTSSTETRGCCSIQTFQLLEDPTRQNILLEPPHKDDEGIIENTGYKKNSFRLNIDQKITKFIDLSLNTNYIHSSADRGYFNNDNTATTMGVSFAGTPSWAYLFPDAQGNYPNNPYSGANFLQTRDLITNNEKVDRFVGGRFCYSQTADSSDNHGLKLIVQGGLDSYTLGDYCYFPEHAPVSEKWERT